MNDFVLPDSVIGQKLDNEPVLVGLEKASSTAKPVLYKMFSKLLFPSSSCHRPEKLQ